MKNTSISLCFLAYFMILSNDVLFCQISCVICDTKPWDTPFGDCISGHTDLDGIEWPAKSLIVNGGISIQDLMNDPLINPNDVMPRIEATCTNFTMVLKDAVTKIGDSIIIDRIWSLLNTKTNEKHTYLQIIKTLANTSNTRKICVKDANGKLLDKVKLFDTVFTNKDDCTEIDYSVSNKKIIPTRDDIDALGVDIVDLVMLQNKVLKRLELNGFQIQASDINRDGKTTGNDLSLLQKIINNETLIEPLFWRFYNVSNWIGQFPSCVAFPFDDVPLLYYADISNGQQSYNFRGYKIGDLDSSYGNDYSVVSLLANDKILKKEEEYDLILKVDRPHLLEGLQMDIMKSSDIEILDIDSPSLPNFNQNHIADLSDRKRILWYNSNEVDGLPFIKDDTIIVLHIKVNSEIKLSEAFKMGTTDRNKIKSINTHYPNYQFKLEWTGLISGINSTSKNDGFFIYPNIANDKLYIKSEEKLNHISILDMSGKKVSYFDNNENELSISTLQDGIYIIQAQTNSGKYVFEKFVVAK